MPLSTNRDWEAWNRKLHFYLGLYFLFFLWLFTFSGLLLNHSNWQFAEFSPQRTETSFERSVQLSTSDSNVDQAMDIMRQLELTGEIDWPNQEPVPGQLNFAVNRPGNQNRVSVDFAQNRATVQNIRINSWGLMRALHSFSGTPRNSPTATGDWVLTTVWVVAMDALSVRVLLMVFSSYYMWYHLKQKRSLGIVSLATGVLSCGVFVIGLSLARIAPPDLAPEQRREPLLERDHRYPQEKQEASHQAELHVPGWSQRLGQQVAVDVERVKGSRSQADIT
jgi:hypothetical protein